MYLHKQRIYNGKFKNEIKNKKDIMKKDIKTLKPKDTVKALNRFIIGQDDAKKAVAIALRNRYRRKQIEKPLQDEIVPKNILMIGPTGVGKTEIARRLAKLADAPFIKVEATKFTEVGYVGKDVDSIIRDLVDIAVKQFMKKAREENEKKAEETAKARIMSLLLSSVATMETRDSLREKIDSGKMDDKEIELEVFERAMPRGGMFDFPGGQIGMISIGDMIEQASGKKKREKKKMKVKDALKHLIAEESEKLIDEEKIVKEAIDITEQEGIVFIDEIDKVTSNESLRGASVSREGVQRDLLPLVEGATINTKYGLVRTNHILFIASGAFHTSSVSDLLPELQGRFPIRVQLNALTEKDLERILKEPEASLIKQYTALIKTEGVSLEFTSDGIKEIALLSSKINSEVENIGARRLYTLMEKILEDVSFEAPDLPKEKVIKVNKKYVNDHIGDLTQKIDLKKFIL